MQCVMERWRKIAWTSRCKNPVKNTEWGIIRRWFSLMGRWFTPLAGAADQARLAGNQTERIKLSICNFSERGRLQSDLIVLGLWRHSWCHHGGNCQVQRKSKMMRSIFVVEIIEWGWFSTYHILFEIAGFTLCLNVWQPLLWAFRQFRWFSQN